MSNLFPHSLFGNYIVEIAKLFKFKFYNFKLTPDKPISPLSVYYGTPRSAFRYWQKTTNGQPILPTMSFYGVDYRRRADKECPNSRMIISDPRSYDPKTGTVTATFPPMHYDVTYQFTLYNNNMRERDTIMHQIIQMFPRQKCSLRWFPDPRNWPNIFLFMPLTLEENFDDETEIEGLDQSETRDVVKTVFTITSHAILPYDVMVLPAVQAILFEEKIIPAEQNQAEISINLQMGNSLFWHEFISDGRKLRFSGMADTSLNDSYIYHYQAQGQTLLRGAATSRKI